MVSYLIVSFLACIVGTICGIGGGIIVKPILDLFGWDSIASINFLSNCMVLAMSFYSVITSFVWDKNSIKLKDVTALAIGAALGGALGSYLFDFIKNQFLNPNMIGSVQSSCLIIICITVLIYTIFKSKIKEYNVTGITTSIIIGLVLGLVSSFLGIGGGPINILVLCLFFGMDSKTSAVNSLYIILISKITNVFTTVFSGNVPPVELSTLGVIIFGAITGSIIGRRINKNINNRAIDRLFIILMIIIIFISGYNVLQYGMN